MGVKHNIVLNTWDQKIAYYLWKFILNYLLRIKLINYLMSSIVLNIFVKLLYFMESYVKRYSDKHYKHIKYEYNLGDNEEI